MLLALFTNQIYTITIKARAERKQSQTKTAQDKTALIHLPNAALPFARQAA
jgi:hypothetical protein